MGLRGSAESVDSLDQVVVAVMIEKRSVVDDLEEVLSISDIDMVQWGPTDYSMNIGRPGQTDAPEVVAAHDRVFRTALEMGVRPRAEIRTASEAKRYLDMGVRHFAVGVDLNVLYAFWRGGGGASGFGARGRGEPATLRDATSPRWSSIPPRSTPGFPRRSRGCR